MGAHPRAFERLTRLLRPVSVRRHRYTVGTRERTALDNAIDRYLAEWYDIAHRATEWDAYHWGFDPDGWMHRERTQMGTRTGMVKGRDGRWYEVHR